MKTKALPTITASLLLLAIAGLGGSLRAENEPTDDTVGGATPIPIGSPSTPEPPSTGMVGDADTDCYVITNGLGFKKIRISYSYAGSGADTTRLRVLASDGTTELSNQVADTSTEFAAFYTINAQTGETYYLCVEDDSAAGTPEYSLSVWGTPDIHALRKINREIGKLKRKLKKAKKNDSKRAVKKLTKKIKKKEKKKRNLLKA